MKPTDEQIKEFWEWCGVQPHIKITGVKYHAGMALDGSGRMESVYPPPDLNNLFKYAVPKLQYQVNLKNIRDGWLCMLFNGKQNPPRIEVIGEDPALALFWVIYEVLK